jgi:putative acetyltransferase
MSVLIRPLRPEDVRAWIEAHHAAVRASAAADYPPAVINAWAPMPITEADVARVAAEADALRLVATLNGRVVGIGAVVPAGRELRACYVHPDAGRRGVGRAIVAALEAEARAQAAPWLDLDASLNAAPFYAALGYAVVEHGSHTLNGGAIMACVRMRKTLIP